MQAIVSLFLCLPREIKKHVSLVAVIGTALRQAQGPPLLLHQHLS